MRLFVISVIVLLFAWVTNISTYSIDEREWGVVTQFGELVRTDNTPGLRFKMPGIIHKVSRFDKRLQQFDTQSIQLLLGDKNPIIVSCFVAWAIKDPVLYFQSIGTGENAEKKISDMVNSQLGIVFSNYDINQIINTDANQVKLSEIENRIVQVANESAVKKYGIGISHVGIIRLAYPAVVMKSVYERINAEREMEAEKIRAEGREDAGKITAEATKQASDIRARAEKKALIIRGQAEKKAMEVHALAYSKDPEYFEFIRSLEVYKEVLGKNTVLLLSTKSDFLKHLVDVPSLSNQNHE